MTSLAFGLHPECGFTFDDNTCEQTGHHTCTLRGDKVVGFIQEVCVHLADQIDIRPPPIRPVVVAGTRRGPSHLQ